MGGFSENHINSYEKKISLYQLHRMYQDGRLVFPPVPAKTSKKKVEKVSSALEAILMGVILPVVYASERQDGSLLVQDSSDRLQCLMEFLEGRFPAAGLEFYPELDGCRLNTLERHFPRISSLIYDSKIFLQVIEYTTPKYMHMQVGNYMEKRSFTREQGVRNELYGKDLLDVLDYLERSLGRPAVFFSRQKLNRQYMILRILMYRFVFTEEIPEEYGEEMGLQQLLDRTVECLRKKDDDEIEELAEDFESATRKLIKQGEQVIPELVCERGKERQAKTLGYLYHVVWMCRERGYRSGKGLKQILSDRELWEQIKSDKVTFANIRRHYHEMEMRLR